VLVPGSAPHRPEKRWPASRYQELALALRTQGITPVVIGSAAEASIGAQIPAAFNLIGQTSFGDLADLARAARFSIGNDTGPTHLLAAAGSPAVVLFSHASNPALCAPVGPDVRVLRRPHLASLEMEAVLAVLPYPVAA
jgi:ADP-heptose:LPS heptosyltransferase